MAKNNEVKKIFSNINSQEKIELLEQLNIQTLDQQDLESLVLLIDDNDNGIRNCITNLFSFSDDPRIPAMLVKYISSTNISSRNLAGEILVNIGSNSVDSLIGYLGEVKNYDDQKFIIDLLGLIKNNKAEEAIVEILRNTKDANVKLSCIEALGNMESEKSVGLILTNYDEDDIYKPTINEALGKIGSQEALDFMIKKYPVENDLTKYSIIESLGIIGNMETFFFLISELNTSEGPLIWVLINSIKQLSEKLNLDVPFDEKMRNAILATIYQANSEFKKSAIHLLKEFNDKEIVTACLTALGEDHELDEILRTKVIQNKEHSLLAFPSLLKMKLKNSECVLNLLNDIIDSLEIPVTNILKGLSLRNLIDALSDYLSNSDEEARRISMNLLFRIDSKTALLFSDKMLSDDNIWNKLRFVDNLAEIEDESANKILEILTEDSEIMVSNRASELLKQRTSIYN